MTRKSTRTKKDVAARRARAHELAAAGHTIAAIARELGCSGSTAHDMVRRRTRELKREGDQAVPTPSVVVSSTNRSARRPTLAECLGVPERWQALACLYAMLFSTWSHALAPWACGWSERASAAVLQGDEAAMRQVANYALETAADADEPEPERAICRELACELVERRRKQEAGR